MPHMQKILEGVSVARLIDELNRHEDVWDRYNMRTAMYGGSPHREVSDIWLRANDFSNFDPDNPLAFSDEHEPVWYAAAYEMPLIKKTIQDIFILVGGIELGGALITKIPAGKQCYPHEDHSWHAHYYSKKYLLLLQSAPGQSFEFGEEKHEGKAGELFIFCNQPEHAVYNNSDIDRISLILAVR